MATAGFFQPDSWATPGMVRLKVIPECGLCGDYKHSKSPKMPVGGTGKRRVMLVTAAPGMEEDDRNGHLLGEAGRLARRLLADVGVRADDCLLTSALICRPPGRVDVGHVSCCRPNLHNAVTEFHPDVIIPMGITAVRSVVGDDWGGDVGEIDKWVGWSIPSAKLGAWVCPTFDPAFAVERRADPALLRIMSQHLQAAFDLEGTKPDPLDLDKASARTDIVTDVRHTRMLLKELNLAKGKVAFDYETDSLKPERPDVDIYCGSFFHEDGWGFCGPIDASCHPALSKVLRNPKLLKSGHNIKFENRWTIAKLRHGVTGWYHDSMLAAHCLDNREGITGLKFQAFVHFGVGDYDSAVKGYLKGVPGPGESKGNAKNRVREAPLKAVLKYCMTDSVLEHELTLRQLETLPPAVGI